VWRSRARHYEHLSGRLRPYYCCIEEVVRRAGKPCQWVHGLAVDEAVDALLLPTVAPAAIEVALAVQEEIAQRIAQAGARRGEQLERARYEAELDRRRYAKVDPDNRQEPWRAIGTSACVIWISCSASTHRARRTSSLHLTRRPRRITELARDFPRVWNDARTSALERKRMLVLLIEDVTLVAGPSIAVHVRWRGGRTQSLCVGKPRPMALIRKTAPEVVRLIDELVETCNDAQVAARLNELGHRNWRGDTFTAKKVTVVRSAYKLQSRHQRLRLVRPARAHPWRWPTCCWTRWTRRWRISGQASHLDAREVPRSRGIRSPASSDAAAIRRCGGSDAQAAARAHRAGRPMAHGH
jgi:hypothetical protein